MFKAYSDKVTFIGEPTSGANGDVVKIDIPGGIYFYYSSIDWHFPNGEQLSSSNIKSLVNKKDMRDALPSNAILKDYGSLIIEAQSGYWQRYTMTMQRVRKTMTMEVIAYTIFMVIK